MAPVQNLYFPSTLKRPLILLKPRDDLFHLLNLICLKYTGQYLPSDCEPTNQWKYIVVDGKRMAIQPKVSVRSVMDYCAFNPLALQIKRQMINDEIMNGVFSNKEIAIAKVNKYLNEHSCDKIEDDDHRSIKYGVRDAVMNLFQWIN